MKSAAMAGIGLLTVALLMGAAQAAPKTNLLSQWDSGSDAAAIIAFEPKLFGVAANNGQMIAEVESSSKIAETFSELARVVTGRSEIRKVKRTLLEPLMTRFRKKAS